MSGLIEQLLASPRRVGFYRAVQILERATHDAQVEGAAPPRVGDDGPPSRELLRFRHDPSLAFSTSDVSSIVARPRRLGETGDGPEGPVYEITTTFLGLTGTVSPLPTYFAEEVLHEDPDHRAQRDFLDMFHHRVLSLFYRAHQRYSLTTEHLSSSRDLWSLRMLALAGVDAFDGKKPPVGLSLPKLLRLSPLLATRARTAAGMVACVKDVMDDVLTGAPVNIEQFVGRWVTIDEKQLLKLGVVNTTLGVDATVGRKVFDRGGKFRLILGPLKRAAFQRFLPGGDALPRLRELVTFYTRDPLEFDLELVLAPGETPSLRLSSREDGASRLGLDTWVTVGADRETRVIVPVPLQTGPEEGESPASDSTPEGEAVNGTARRAEDHRP